MNKEELLEKIEYLSSMPHSSLVEHCIYLENENDNYKAQKYITDFISENGIICGKNKKISELQQKIDKAIELLNELLSDTKGILKDYSYHKEHNKILIELLKEDEQIYIKLLEILGDKENE